MELYRKYRPTSFKQVKGQPEAIKILNNFIKEDRVPHAILLHGPSGVGKTTVARILKVKLGCDDIDFQEVNCADFRGIEMVREIRSRMGLAPLGRCRIWLIDECHKMSSDGQSAILKMLEDSPNHVYFIFCTTDPPKLLRTIVTRCAGIKLEELKNDDLAVVIQDICKREGSELSEEVIDRIVEVSEGSARQALMILESVITLESDEERLQAILANDVKRQAIDLARALINPKSKWNEISALLKGIKEEPEKIRHLVLSYASSVLLGGGALKDQAYFLVRVFQYPFYDSKKPGLVAACYEVATKGKR